MKKLLALLCAAAMAFAVVGCSIAPSQSSSQDSSTSESSSQSTADTDPTVGDDTVDPGEEGTVGEGEAVQPAEADAELSALVDSIYAIADPGIMVETRAVDPSDASWLPYYTGLTDGSDIDAAVASEAMIGSQAYSLVLVRVKDGVDAAEFANQMAAAIDPAKWVCAQADDIQVGAAGNIAMLIMLDSQLDASASAIADAFVTASGVDGASCWVPETIGEPGHTLQ